MSTTQEIRVLGSVGPFANQPRASSGFLVLEDGAPMLVRERFDGEVEVASDLLRVAIV